MRISLMAALLLASVAGAGAQVTTPAPSPSPAAPPTGSPALSPVPSTPSPGGVALPPTPGVNSTPSQSNVDLYPPSRLTTPGAAAGQPTVPSQTPGATPSDPPSYGGRPQPGGANSSAPPKTPKKTGTDYGLAECFDLWDAGTHMSKKEWRVACQRVQSRLDSLERTARENGVKKTPPRRASSE